MEAPLLPSPPSLRGRARAHEGAVLLPVRRERRALTFLALFLAHRGSAARIASSSPCSWARPLRLFALTTAADALGAHAAFATGGIALGVAIMCALPLVGARSASRDAGVTPRSSSGRRGRSATQPCSARSPTTTRARGRPGVGRAASAAAQSSASSGCTAASPSALGAVVGVLVDVLGGEASARRSWRYALLASARCLRRAPADGRAARPPARAGGAEAPRRAGAGTRRAPRRARGARRSPRCASSRPSPRCGRSCCSRSSRGTRSPRSTGTCTCGSSTASAGATRSSARRASCSRSRRCPSCCARATCSSGTASRARSGSRARRTRRGSAFTAPDDAHALAIQ